MAKETLYIEADDEITAVIEKVLTAKDAIVAVVLPKRAAVFQSVVNMKLLKKAAEESKKRVVLISSEKSIQSIAAVAGMHLATSLTSKPFIPKRTKTTSVATISSTELEDGAAAESPDEGDNESEETSADKEENETIELDNTNSDAKELPAGTLAQSATEIPKKKSKLPRIPDFGSFQLKLWLGIFAVVLLIAGWFVGFVVMPKATVTINTDTSSTEVAFDFVVATDVDERDIEKSVIPAELAEVSKENKVTVPATGEKNIGEVARGTAEFTARVCAPNLGTTPAALTTGTGISAAGKTYILQEDLTFSFTGFGGGSCANYASDEGVIVAQGQGSSFNVSGATFTVAGRSDASGEGSASGGTDSIVKVVSAQDIAKATEQLKGASRADAVQELSASLTSQQLQPLAETIEESAPVVASSPAVDVEAAEVTVTQTIVYKMLGIASSDLGELLDAKISESIKDSSKSVRSNGLDSAVYRLTTKSSATNQTINLQTVATLGAIFDENAIAEEVRGKKRGDIERLLESREGVRSVSVEYSPFWISTTPKSANKIQINVNEVEN